MLSNFYVWKNFLLQEMMWEGLAHHLSSPLSLQPWIFHPAFLLESIMATLIHIFEMYKHISEV